MERHQTKLRPVERKDKRLKQRGYLASMQTRRPQHKINQDKKKKTTKLKK